MAGLMNNLLKWATGSGEPSSPNIRGSTVESFSHSEHFQTAMSKSENSMDFKLLSTMPSCSTLSMQDKFMSSRLLSRHGEPFLSRPLEMPKSEGALGLLSRHGDLLPLPLEMPKSDGALSESLRELQRIHSEFVKTIKISVIRGLLDDLLQQKVFSTEDKDSVENQMNKREKARCLIDMVTGKGERASQIMIDSMKKRDPELCITLGLISSPAGHIDDKMVVKPRKQNKGNRVRKISESEEEVANKKSCTVDGSEKSTETRSAGQALTEKELMNLAKTLGQEWEQVAIHLDLKTKDLDDIKADRQTDVAMQKLNMLLLWTRRRPQGKATAQDLLRGLKGLDLRVETHQLLTDLMK